MNLSDRFKAGIEAFVTRITARYDYAALYPCKVVSQNGDGSLELQPDATNIMPGMSNVPIRYGIPGITVKVASGARVLLGFENADPAKPVATLWEEHDLKEIKITASAKVEISSPDIKIHGGMVTLVDGGQPIARQGDTVMVTCTAPGTPAFGQIMTGNPMAKA